MVKKARSPYADGRGSAVNPDVEAAMRGEGGARPAPPPSIEKQIGDRSRAGKMDRGEQLSPLKR